MKGFFGDALPDQNVSAQDSVIEKFDIHTMVQEELERQNSINIKTPTPEPIPTPTPEPVILKDYYDFSYSYYYPDLGGVNCHEANWNGQNCANTTASGKGWREYLHKGIAIHWDFLEDLPFGTIIEVTSPEEVKGIYEVIDICSGCRPKMEGQPYYIDFLDDVQRLPWGAIIKAEVIKNE